MHVPNGARKVSAAEGPRRLARYGGEQSSGRCVRGVVQQVGDACGGVRAYVQTGGRGVGKGGGVSSVGGTQGKLA